MMVRVSEISGRDSYRRVPRIDRSEVLPLWVSDYYDAPLNGMLQYQGQKYWYQIVDEELWKNGEEAYETPIYLIVALTESQRQEEEYWHELFCRQVWNGWDYGDDEKVIWSHHPEQVRRGTKESAREFYAAYRRDYQRDFSNNPVIGWFSR